MNQLEKNAIADMGETLLGTLDEILGELRKSATARTATEQKAKVEIKTSTRGADVTVTAYTDTEPDELHNASLIALQEYRRLMAELSENVMDGFRAEAAKAR